MNILYGVQTTGHGHYIRSRTMITRLKQRGHKVYTLLSGAKLKDDWDLSFFEPFSYHKGLTFITERGKISLKKTARQLDIAGFYRDILQFDDFKNLDLVITDYEPITARIAKLRKIPSIGIGHMYAFAHKVPIASFNPFTTVIMKHFAPVKYPVGLHWYHYGQSILPPTIPADVVFGENVLDNKILVYLGFEAVEDIVSLLQPFSDYEFFIYSRVEKSEDRGHLHIRPFGREDFLQDLRESSGVIANGGFSLASEALHLGKKLLIKPVKGQIEQYCNAFALLRLKLGSVMDRLDPEAVRQWLEFPPIESMNYLNVIEPFLDWIESGNWGNTEQLIHDSWKASKKALNENQNFTARDFSGKLKKYGVRYLRFKTPTRW